MGVGGAFTVASKSKAQLKREKAAEAKATGAAGTTTGVRPGPGDPTKPHCPDCAKEGYIYNDHGTSKTRPCHRGNRGGVYVAAAAAAQSDLQDRLDAEDRRAALRPSAEGSYTAADVQRLVDASLAAATAYPN